MTYFHQSSIAFSSERPREYCLSSSIILDDIHTPYAMAHSSIGRVEDPTYSSEKKDGNGETPPMYDDPFGDEEFAEVKYRTLRWW